MSPNKLHNSSTTKKILKAIKNEDISLIEKLSAKNGDSDVSPLHLVVGAADENFALRAVRHLLKNGADPNALASGGVTPVHVASAWNRVNLLHLLLNSGGDPWQEDDDLRNAFNYAFEESAWLSIELLHKFHLTRSSITGKISKKSDSEVLLKPLTENETVNEIKQVERRSTSTQTEVKETPIFCSALTINPYVPNVASPEVKKIEKKFVAKSSLKTIEENPRPNTKLFEELSEAVKRRALRISINENLKSSPSPENVSKKSDNSFFTCSEGQSDSSGVISSSLNNLEGQQEEPPVDHVSSKEEMSSVDSDQLRDSLLDYGIATGPITKSTKRIYQKKMKKLVANRTPKVVVKPKKLSNSPKNISSCDKRIYSLELGQTIKSESSLELVEKLWMPLEAELSKMFEIPEKKRRGGSYKTSFNYILLDSRITDNLPEKFGNQPKFIIWKIFLSGIFYVGKGTSGRPFAHLYQALQYWTTQKRPLSDAKLSQILDIWRKGFGVVCLHVFHNIIQTEALTREAAMLDALTLRTVRNKKRGEYYGPPKFWPTSRKKQLGSALLYKAFNIFLHEGERQIRPNDIS